MLYICNYCVADLHNYLKFQAPPYIGDGWSVRFVPMDEYITDQFMSSRFTGPDGDEHEEKGTLVAIEAPSYFAAIEVAQLIASVLSIIDDAGTFNIEVLPYPSIFDPEGDIEEREYRHHKKQYLGRNQIPLACMLAAAASYDASKYDAIYKLALSYEIASTWPLELDPFHSPNLPRALFPMQYHAYAQAIVATYSAIETIGLEVRASMKNPSRVEGKWNPTVKTELEARLSAAGIDLSDHFLWCIRGASTALEADRPTEHVKKAEWAAGDVNDEHVEVVDAIADVSWLRSKVAAHKSRDLVRLLSPYDVSNAQSLARRLILESMGAFNIINQVQQG